MGGAFAAALLAAATLGGCEAAPDGEVVRTTSALTNYDYTVGKLHVRMKACDPTAPPAGHNWTTCPVDPGFVVVGGGAEVVGGDSMQPGALLYASIRSGESWAAGSKHHVYQNPRTLRAYSLGLRIDGVSETDLRTKFIRRVSAESPWGERLYARVNGPAGFILIGGGAETIRDTRIHVDCNCSDDYLMLLRSRASHDVSGDFWEAEAKDHLVVQHGFLHVEATFLAQTIPGIGTFDRQFTYGSSAYCNDSYCKALAYGDIDYVVTSVGAESPHAPSVGRLLTQLLPYGYLADNGFPYPGATATNKDHGVVDRPEWLQAQMVQLRLP
jgi:hypothetical protein